MSKSNISDIDYSIFSSSPAEEKPAEQQKTIGVFQRNIVKPKAKQEETPRDLTGASDSQRVAERTTELANALPNVTVPDKTTDYALAALGLLGSGLAAWGLTRGRGEPSLKAPQDISAPKPDMRDMLAQTTPPAPQAPAPVQQPTFTGNAQPTTLPTQQGYGATTMNAPTGAPAVPPTAGAGPQPVAPAPVDPIQAARIREAEAKAAIAEHKLQQLQAGPKTTPAAKVGKAPVSEAELQMIQKSGAAGTAKELQAMEAASKIAPTPDPIQTTATPVEKQAAVDVVKSKPESIVKKPKAVVPPGMTKEEFGMMNHLLGTYGGKQEPMAMKAYEQVKEILGYTPAYPKGQGGSLTPEETGKVLGWRKENISGPKVNLTHEMKGTLKKGGAAAIAAMILTPEFAKASTTEKRQMIGESLLPIGLTPSELASGTLSPEQRAKQEEIALLGSPFYNTQAAKNIRQANKVGAGRGIAPPSAYQR